MADILTPAQRKYNMQQVRSKGTAPELIIRRALYAKGFRYRLHVKSLPGSPDLVFAKYKTVIFVHGCFWQKHNCFKASIPTSRTEFWIQKFKGNTTRDKRNIQYLTDLGWRILIIWECALKGRSRIPFDLLIEAIGSFVKNDSIQLLELSGTN